LPYNRVTKTTTTKAGKPTATPKTHTRPKAAPKAAPRNAHRPASKNDITSGKVKPAAGGEKKASNVKQNVPEAKPLDVTGATEAACHNYIPREMPAQETTYVDNITQMVKLGALKWQSTASIPPFSYSSSQQDNLYNAISFTNFMDHNNIASLTLPFDILSRVPNMPCYLKNIWAIKSGAEINIRVMSTKKHQGLLAAYYLPYKEQKSFYGTSSTRHMRSVSQMPGFQVLNLRADNPEMTIKVPFTSKDGLQIVEHAMTNSNNSCRQSCLYIVPLCPLRNKNATCEVDIIVSGRLTEFYSEGKMPRATDLMITQEAFATAATNQSGKGIEMPSERTVGEAPNLGSLVVPMARLALEATEVMVGLSKPLTDENIVTICPARGYTHGVGFDQSVPLTMVAHPSMNTMPDCPSVDEMSLKYIASRPYIHDTITIDTTDVTGKILGIYPVHPIDYRHMAQEDNHSKVNDSCQKLICGSQLAYCVAPWGYWRADSMSLGLQISCTEEVKCQLVVQYVPQIPYKGNETEPQWGPFTYESVSMTEIIDVTAETTVDMQIISFPLHHRTCYQRVKAKDQELQENDLNCVSGFYIISLMSPLISSAVVSNKIDIVVYEWFDGFRAKDFGLNTPQPFMVAEKPDSRVSITPAQPVNDWGAFAYSSIAPIPRGGGDAADTQSGRPKRKLNKFFREISSCLQDFLHFAQAMTKHSSRAYRRIAIQALPPSSSDESVVFNNLEFDWDSEETPIYEKEAATAQSGNGPMGYDNTRDDFEDIDSIRLCLHRSTREAATTIRAYPQSGVGSLATADVSVISWAPPPMPFCEPPKEDSGSNGYTTFWPAKYTPFSCRNYYSLAYSIFKGPVRAKSFSDKNIPLQVAWRVRNVDDARKSQTSYCGWGASHTTRNSAGCIAEVVLPQSMERRLWINGSDNDVWHTISDFSHMGHREGNACAVFVNDHFSSSTSASGSHQFRDCHTVTALGEGASYFGLVGCPPFTFGMTEHQFD
jgi:hypothetical protein